MAEPAPQELGLTFVAFTQGMAGRVLVELARGDSDMLTERDMRNILRHRCEEAGGQRKWAETHGFSAPYVNLVLSGRRPIHVGIAKALGYYPKKIFIPCDQDEDV